MGFPFNQRNTHSSASLGALQQIGLINYLALVLSFQRESKRSPSCNVHVDDCRG